MRIAVTCGGTGGHVFPGVATASAIRDKGHDVRIVLSGRSVEGEKPGGWDGVIIHVPCRQPSWSNPVSAAKSLGSLASAFIVAVQALRRYRPDALLAMGSYTSLPPVLAARLLRIPVVLHEANAIPGVAVSRLCRMAERVCIAFEEAARHLPKSVKTVNTGLPVRNGIAGQPPGVYADPSRFTILVMGGSQGSQAVNNAVAGAVRLLANDPAEAPSIRILHLAGKKNEDAVREAYRGITSIPVTVIGFSNEMGSLYAASDFCISRAGAASCFELCLCGLPALLVPLPGLAHDHQTANARALARLGACDVKAQSELSAEGLAEYVKGICKDKARLDAMRAALRANSRPDAAGDLADCVIQTAAEKQRTGPSATTRG